MTGTSGEDHLAASAAKLGGVSRPKTLIFCTAYAGSIPVWNRRYRRWLKAVHQSSLHFDHLLIVDDGSPALPEWTGTQVVTDLDDVAESSPIVLYHFPDNLGRLALFDFPGWYRSFTFAAKYARRFGFQKVIHIESDAFVISRRMQDYMNNVVEGWVAFWCERWNVPETALQVIAGTSLRAFFEQSQVPHSTFIGRHYEFQLPFTVVEKSFQGDRYGEYLDHVPKTADYVTQAPSAASSRYFWWLAYDLDFMSTGGIATHMQSDDEIVPARGKAEMRITQDLTLLVHPRMRVFLDRVVEMFAEGLTSIGIEPVAAYEPQPGFGERAIVFGANFFAETQLLSLARNSVIFNVENVQSDLMTDEYRRLLRNFHVWDYSRDNARELSAMLRRPVHYAKLFYVNRLSRIPQTIEKDIDVLFYGSFNSRRSAVLDDLRARGLRVEAVFRVFGADLDALIARAKVVINIHFYDNGHLELIRLFDLLANGCVVVSELNPGEAIDADIANALVFAPYDRLVDAAEALVRDPDRRREAAAAGFRMFARRTAKEILPQLLAESEAPVLPSRAVIGSGRGYDPNAVNIDANPTWHPDIIADITDPGLFEREFPSQRFGTVALQRGWFDTVEASHILEHLPDLTTAMANILDLLAEGGALHVTVPYDLSYGAWQDPTHVRAFNERSWLYYCEWCWYLGWSEARFDLIEQRFRNSSLGDALSARGHPNEEILRTPRAVDEMSVVLRKRLLTEAERAHGRTMRGDAREPLVAAPVPR
jgi:SAM-dependent methyltransferase